MIASFRGTACGYAAEKGAVPCVERSAGSKVRCSIRPAADCVDRPGRYTRSACSSYRSCVEAADVNYDYRIDANDSGVCVPTPTPTSTPTHTGTPTSTQTPTPTSTPTETGTPTPVPTCPFGEVEPGEVMMWGDDSQGKHDSPPGLSGLVSIGAGDDNTIALRADGTVFAWGGDNLYGQNDLPLGLANVSYLAVGPRGGIAITRPEREVLAWGDDTYGQVSGMPDPFIRIGEGPVIRGMKWAVVGGTFSVASDWVIWEGRECARAVDAFLMGQTDLPSSPIN